MKTPDFSRIHQMEQMAGALRETAQQQAAFFNALLAEGLSRVEARHLTGVMLQSMLLAAWTQTNEGNGS